MPQLSVIMPVYNEAETIRQILQKINSLDINKEIILIDDGSTDDTSNILKEINFNNLKIVYHTANRGKGAAILTGLSWAEGEIVIIQDADLEYDPHDYFKLIEAKEKTKADLVLGVRFTRGYHGLFIPRLGNRLITRLLNFFFGVNLNDCLTCYKLAEKETLKNLHLSAKGFDIEIEIVTKAIRNKLRILEVPIFYQPRSYREGKKIRWKDGIKMILAIIRFRFFTLR